MKNYVLVHGLPDHSGTWEKLLPIIAKTSNEIAIIGLPGISDGLSLKEDSSLIEIADRLAAKIPFKDAVYIGHDFGAILGTVVAQLRPELISKMILINGSTPTVLKNLIASNPDQAARSRYAEKIVKDPEQTLSYNDFIFLKAYLFKEEIGASEVYKQSLIKLWSKSLTQKNIGTYYRAFLNTQFDNVTFAQSALQIWSTRDPFIGPSVQSEMKSIFSNHKTFDLDSDSHWPQLSHVEIVGSVIEDFLEGM